MNPRIVACTFFALAAADVSAAMYRCIVPGGGVSYQEFPCAREDQGGPVDLPTNFPEVNWAARDSLMQREADLYRRLEAQRERLSREEMTRTSARAQVDAAQAAAQAITEPTVYYAPVWPFALRRPPLGAHRVPQRTLLR